MRITALVLAVLAGCATPHGSPPDVRGSWTGATYDDVVLQWGTPVRSAKLSDGRDAYTWVSEASVPHTSAYPSVGIGMGSGGVGVGTGVTFGTGGGELARCERTLIFKDGRVVDQTWQGAPDYCAGFGRGAPARP
jgi:hypothetical protein